MKKIYSTNNEWFSYSDPDECARDVVGDLRADELEKGSIVTIYEADFDPKKASYYAPDIIYFLQEASKYNVPEGDIWPDVSNETKKQLQIAIEHCIDKWADYNDIQPKFGEVFNVKAVEYIVADSGDEYGCGIEIERVTSTFGDDR